MKKRSRREKAKLAWKVFFIACGVFGVGMLLMGFFGCLSVGGGDTSCGSQSYLESMLGATGLVITGIGYLLVLPMMLVVVAYFQLRKWFSRNPDAID